MIHAAALIVAAAAVAGPVAGPVAARADAQALSGRWEGSLSLGEASLRLVVRIQDGAAFLDSPDQGAVGIPVSDVVLDGSRVTFAAPSVGGRFEGTLAGDTLTGAWTQGASSAPLILTRTSGRPADAPEEAAEATPARPQTPVPPFPYVIEQVRFDNARADVTLAGTLTLPEGPGPHPAVVLITGSGPQDRDETLFGHRPFAVLAHALTRRGVAVLRYDDRGVGASTGDFASAVTPDFAEDAAAALTHLRGRPEIDAARLGLVGHSEGAIAAALVADDDPDVAFLAMMAGSAVAGGEILKAQQRSLATALGAPEAAIQAGAALQAAIMADVAANADDGPAVAQAVQAHLVAAGQPEAQARAAAEQMASPWYRWFVAHDPADSLAGIRAPILALYGDKDLQVPAELNRAPLLAAAPQAEVVVLPGLNHLFQTAETGLPTEYGQIEETLAPAALDALTDWIAARAGRP